MKTYSMRTFKTYVNSAVLVFIFIHFNGNSQSKLKGDSVAIKHMQEMIEKMGGIKIWSELKQLHFQHVWYPINRETYFEDEIIDLTGPRSWVRMKSEIFDRIRGYSPEYKYWSVTNGKYSENEESLKNAIKRAPFNIYRIAHSIAAENFPYEIKMGKTDIPTGVKIEFFLEDGSIGGGIVLDGANCPLVWETPQFTYTFGPMKRFNNLWVPEWAIYNQGSFRYLMVSLRGDNVPINLEKFKADKS